MLAEAPAARVVQADLSLPHAVTQHAQSMTVTQNGRCIVCHAWLNAVLSAAVDFGADP
jgi:hypothetical protein